MNDSRLSSKGPKSCSREISKRQNILIKSVFANTCANIFQTKNCDGTIFCTKVTHNLSHHDSLAETFFREHFVILPKTKFYDFTKKVFHIFRQAALFALFGPPDYVYSVHTEFFWK